MLCFLDVELTGNIKGISYGKSISVTENDFMYIVIDNYNAMDSSMTTIPFTIYII
jgi:hypothetical protein